MRALRRIALCGALLSAALGAAGCSGGEKSLIDIMVKATGTALGAMRLRVTGIVGTFQVNVFYPDVPQQLAFPVHVKLSLAENVGGHYKLEVFALDAQEKTVGYSLVEGEHVPAAVTNAEVSLGEPPRDAGVDARPDVTRLDASPPDRPPVEPDGMPPDATRPDSPPPRCEPPCQAPLSCNTSLSPPRCDCAGEVCMAPLTCNDKVAPPRCDCGGELCLAPLTCNDKVAPPRCDCGGEVCLDGQECKDGKCQCLADGTKCSKGEACCSKVCCDGACAQECCMHEGASCAPGGKPCCGDLACCDGICAATCCAQQGDSCETSANCCEGVCLDGKCAACYPPGATCPAGDGCCAGTTCSGGKCCAPLDAACDANKPCCAGTTCDQKSGKCVAPCKNPPDACVPGQCCAGANCQGGKCCYPLGGGTCKSDNECCEGICSPNGVCVAECDPLRTRCTEDTCCAPARCDYVGDWRTCCLDRGGRCGGDEDCCLGRDCGPNGCCDPTGWACELDHPDWCCTGTCENTGDAGDRCCVADMATGCGGNDWECCGHATRDVTCNDNQCCLQPGSDCTDAQGSCCAGADTCVPWPSVDRRCCFPHEAVGCDDMPCCAATDSCVNSVCCNSSENCGDHPDCCVDHFCQFDGPICQACLGKGCNVAEDCNGPCRTDSKYDCTGGQGWCCIDLGQQGCSSQADCCPSDSAYCVAGKCCRQYGGCSSGNDCCDGYICSDGSCVPNT